MDIYVCIHVCCMNLNLKAPCPHKVRLELASGRLANGKQPRLNELISTNLLKCQAAHQNAMQRSQHRSDDHRDAWLPAHPSVRQHTIKRKSQRSSTSQAPQVSQNPYPIEGIQNPPNVISRNPSKFSQNPSSVISQNPEHQPEPLRVISQKPQTSNVISQNTPGQPPTPKRHQPEHLKGAPSFLIL